MANKSNLEKLISAERLKNCSLTLVESSGSSFQVTDLDSLYDLYIQNEVVSKEIKYILSQFEILLRNRINLVLGHNYHPEWIFDFRRRGKWRSDELEQISKAEERLRKLGKEITHDRVIAKLSLGFWLRIFNGPYYSDFIHDHMEEIFPRNKHNRVATSYGISDFRTVFAKISTVRNRVSHLEFILSPKYDIDNLHKNIILVMRMIDKEYYDHFKSKDRFDDEMLEFNNLKTRIIKKYSV